MTKIKCEKVDIGCGLRKFEGHFGIDTRKLPGVDLVMNVSRKKLPFENDSVKEIKAFHVLEHLYPEGLFFLMDECYRVIAPDGFMQVEVPKCGTPAYLVNPDHKIAFTEGTFSFFQVPYQGLDRHGYLKGFWNVQVNKMENTEAINVTLYPNKEGGKFPFVKIQRRSEEKQNNGL